MLKIDIPYGLHDTTINEFLIEKSSIILCFHNGVYTLFNDKEVSLTKSCFVQLEICGFTLNNCYEHLEILQYKKNKYFEISIEQLIKDVKILGFNVDIDFYSPFSRSILIRGFMGRMKTDIIISDIKGISISFKE